MAGYTTGSMADAHEGNWDAPGDGSGRARMDRRSLPGHRFGDHGVVYGSMGSRFMRLRFAPEDIATLAKVDWRPSAPRVSLDPDTGMVELVSPRAGHENCVGGARRLVDEIAAANGLDIAGLRHMRWRRPQDPGCSGWEADECFYIGKRARAFRESIRNPPDDGRTPDGRDLSVAVTPPELVIEVERVWGDESRPDIWREVGVREMWRFDKVGNGLSVDILDLQAEGGSTSVEASAVLPLCTLQFILDGVDFGRRGDHAGLSALVAEVRRAVTPEDDGPAA